MDWNYYVQIDPVESPLRTDSCLQPETTFAVTMALTNRNMNDIRLNVSIKAAPDKIFNAITTQQGLESWWAKQTTAKPEVGFVNTFTFGKFKNEMKVTELIPNKKVKWSCIASIDEWIGTEISFDLEEKDGRTILRFAHSDWRSVTDTFAGCTYDWALFMKSLKSLCETGIGTPS
jgi:uncharacterized protein YndB with AHSA1/START domain